MKTKYGDEVDPFDKLIEEAAEVIQIIIKIKRLGLYDSHPETKLVNINSLKRELIDFEEAKQAVFKEYEFNIKRGVL